MSHQSSTSFALLPKPSQHFLKIHLSLFFCSSFTLINCVVVRVVLSVFFLSFKNWNMLSLHSCISLESEYFVIFSSLYLVLPILLFCLSPYFSKTCSKNRIVQKESSAQMFPGRSKELPSVSSLNQLKSLNQFLDGMWCSSKIKFLFPCVLVVIFFKRCVVPCHSVWNFFSDLQISHSINF